MLMMMWDVVKRTVNLNSIGEAEGRNSEADLAAQEGVTHATMQAASQKSNQPQDREVKKQMMSALS